jgi:poly(hydroxyalkanoate) depolymerase family esterase
MNTRFATAMRRALEQARAQDPRTATEIIREALAGTSRPARSGPIGLSSLSRPLAGMPTLEQGLPGMRREAAAGGLDALKRAPDRRVPHVPDGARYDARHVAGPHGGRDCKLFVPSDRPDGAVGFVLMLHGCTQDADDFACGTDMNIAAEDHGFVVVYPEQSRSHNMQACWNLFRPEDQRREQGEAAILANIAVQIARENGVPRDRVFVAGLSAGGAMAATLAATHPDVFVAAGVHSGLPAGCANDVASAFAAMRGNRADKNQTARIPLIVFHGTADTTVAPVNATRLVPEGGIETAHCGNGRNWTRLTTETGSELWRVHGGGHAWFGGNPAGSYTDPTGPDATVEMLRFFREIKATGR